MQAVANDLNCDLKIVYSDRNHIKMVRLAKKVLRKKKKPDDLIIVNEKLAAQEIVSQANAVGVKTLLILNGFNAQQRKLLGAPREKYKNWLGTLNPNNFTAGYRIATRLIKEALLQNQKAPDGKIHLVGVTGDHTPPPLLSGALKG